MKRTQNNEAMTEALRAVLHSCMDALESRLIERLDAWLQRAIFRRDVQESKPVVTLSPEDYREVR